MFVVLLLVLAPSVAHAQAEALRKAFAEQTIATRAAGLPADPGLACVSIDETGLRDSVIPRRRHLAACVIVATNEVQGVVLTRRGRTTCLFRGYFDSVDCLRIDFCGVEQVTCP